METDDARKYNHSTWRGQSDGAIYDAHISKELGAKDGEKSVRGIIANRFLQIK
jgi:hypothetical protein